MVTRILSAARGGGGVCKACPKTCRVCLGGEGAGEVQPVSGAEWRRCKTRASAKLFFFFSPLDAANLFQVRTRLTFKLFRGGVFARWQQLFTLALRTVSYQLAAATAGVVLKIQTRKK